MTIWECTDYCNEWFSCSSSLEAIGVPTRILSAIEMRQVAEPYIEDEQFVIEKGRSSNI